MAEWTPLKEAQAKELLDVAPKHNKYDYTRSLCGFLSEALAHIDRLTARVAELEKENADLDDVKKDWASVREAFVILEDRARREVDELKAQLAALQAPVLGTAEKAEGDRECADQIMIAYESALKCSENEMPDFRSKHERIVSILSAHTRQSVEAAVRPWIRMVQKYQFPSGYCFVCGHRKGQCLDTCIARAFIAQSLLAPHKAERE